MSLIRNPPRKLTALRTCRHEAAHAVCATDLGIKVLCVLLNHDNSGCTETFNYMRPDPLARALMALSGDAAERMYYRQSRKVKSWGDMWDVLRMGFKRRSIATLERACDGHVHKMRPHIDAVASALMQKKRLTGRSVRRLMLDTGWKP